MSVHALRHLLTLMRGELQRLVADSFYEVLLNARVHGPMQGDGLSWVFGPGGQRALPVFLDQEALSAWPGPRTEARVYSMPQAAELAGALRHERHRAVVPLATIVRGALRLKRQLVLGLPSPYVTVPFSQLAGLWGDG